MSPVDIVFEAVDNSMLVIEAVVHYLLGYVFIVTVVCGLAYSFRR